MKKFALLLLFSTNLFAIDSISEKFKTIVCSDYYAKCDQYNDEEILKISSLLDQASMQYKVSIYKLFALIAAESGFKRDKIFSNINNSKDLGLMQNNSVWIQERCLKVFNRRCSYEEMFDPIISVKLAMVRFKECSKYSNDAFFICYNSDKLAYKYLTSDFYPEYLERLYVEYDVIVGEILGRED